MSKPDPPSKLSEADIRAIYRQGEAAVMRVVLQVLSHVNKLSLARILSPPEFTEKTRAAQTLTPSKFTRTVTLVDLFSGNPQSPLP